MELPMGLPDLGAYLRALRKHQGWTQAKVADLVGVAGNTIYRIEAGRQEPETTQLAALLTVLGGRISDVQKLLTGKLGSATPHDLAREAISEQALLTLLDTDPKRANLLRQIAKLTDDPRLRQRIEDYLRGLEAGNDLQAS